MPEHPPQLSKEAAVAAYLAKQGNYRDIAALAGVSAPTVMRWVKAHLAGPKPAPIPLAPLRVYDGGKVGAAVTGNGRVSLKASGLDHKARTLLRASALRFLGCMAGNVDEAGKLLEDLDWNPRTAKDAALGLAVVVDKCPGILGLHEATEDGTAATLKPGDTGYKAALLEELRQLPRSVLVEAAKEAG